MLREEILLAASKRLVENDEVHGRPEEIHDLIAQYWSSFLLARFPNLNEELAITDVSIMMCLMKLARLTYNAEHLDSWTDGVGYFAIGGELAGRFGTMEVPPTSYSKDANDHVQKATRL